MLTERVPVSEIVEYNWELGNRCHLLNQVGLYPYACTEEEITDYLEQSAKDPHALSICLDSSRCSAFYESFQHGVTPFIDRDPIKLLEYGGKYWVNEGKHRVCMAKRAGITYIDAQVYHQTEDTKTLLPPAGAPGTYSFYSRFHAGEIAILWVVPPRGDYSIFSEGPRMLNLFSSTTHPRREIIPGVYVEIALAKKPGRIFSGIWLRATVTITAEHYNTGIWLYTIPANRSISTFEPKTIFRYGCWRKRHKQFMIPSSRYIID